MASPSDSSRPKKGRYLLNTDGGVLADGNRSHGDPPGEAAIGVVLNDPDDRPVQVFKAAIGPESIPGAEYRALIKGLEIALEHGVDKIRAFVDNQLVVDQIAGLAKVKDSVLKEYHSQTMGLLGRFSDQRVYWIPRERNTEADSLVREVLYPSSKQPRLD
jgi:ribonuclease HI